jgi:SAM-dependent methyltransferase
MESASRQSHPPSHLAASSREAWTAFWTDPGQARCVSGDSELWRVFTRHWSSVSNSLPPGARVLDLGCGAGAVARALLASRGNLQVTGIDYARIPLAVHPSFELLSDTPMESLPFDEAGFGAVVSQFGFEYGEPEATSRELARVLAPRARVSFLVHHAGSSIVATNRVRLQALADLLASPVRTAFCTGDGAAFHGQMHALRQRYPHDGLIAELTRSLPSRLGRAQREKAAIWNSIEDALAPELCLGRALDARCVAAARLDEWLRPLRGLFQLEPVEVLREANGTPIAWRIQGIRLAQAPGAAS